MLEGLALACFLGTHSPFEAYGRRSLFEQTYRSKMYGSSLVIDWRCPGKMGLLVAM